MIRKITEKSICWVGSSKRHLRSFPAEARRDAGYQLRRVQEGLQPEDWKPMSSVGLGVIEIRIHCPHEFRVIYVARFSNAVYVLSAFEKKTEQTSDKELASARRAYAQLKSLQQ